MSSVYLLDDTEPKLESTTPSHVIESGICKSLEEHDQTARGKGLYSKGTVFCLDSQPFRILSGSFHYFRTHPAQWSDRLIKMQAAGLNTVATYIPWNLHEPVKGQYKFDGQWDIARFIQAINRVGMKMIVRPGPYICGEWEFGGFPYWLLSDSNMKVRTSKYKRYLDHVGEYFSHLLPLLGKYTYRNGGPIIAFQIENEFGSQGRKDENYLKFLEQQFYKWGIEEVLFTSDGAEQLPNGTLPNILATLNLNKWPKEKLDVLRKFQPNKPLMVTEFWSGWFDHWGSNHHIFQLDLFEQILDVVVGMNASVNFYMFVGGTNFGQWGGGPFDAKVVTSYDYDSPISESGDVTQKFHVIRQMILKYSLRSLDLPAVPKNPAKASYGTVNVSGFLSFDKLVDIMMRYQSSHNNVATLAQPVTMEGLPVTPGDSIPVSFLVYRKKIMSGSNLTFTGHVADRAQILVNGQEVAVVNSSEATKGIDISLHPNSEAPKVLDILVENMGRSNFKRNLSDQHKGIQGQVLLDGQVLSDWSHVPFLWGEQMIESLLSYRSWSNVLKFDYLKRTTQPRLYKLHLHIKGSPMDTFLDMTGWTKGLVFINTFNLGRYWNIGPQDRLYVPAPILKQGLNSILVFELHTPGSLVSFLDSPSLGETEYMEVEVTKPNTTVVPPA